MTGPEHQPDRSHDVAENEPAAREEGSSPTPGSHPEETLSNPRIRLQLSRETTEPVAVELHGITVIDLVEKLVEIGLPVDEQTIQSFSAFFAQTPGDEPTVSWSRLTEGLPAAVDIETSYRLGLPSHRPGSPAAERREGSLYLSYLMPENSEDYMRIEVSPSEEPGCLDLSLQWYPPSFYADEDQDPWPCYDIFTERLGFSMLEPSDEKVWRAIEIAHESGQDTLNPSLEGLDLVVSVDLDPSPSWCADARVILRTREPLGQTANPISLPETSPPSTSPEGKLCFPPTETAPTPPAQPCAVLDKHPWLAQFCVRKITWALTGAEPDFNPAIQIFGGCAATTSPELAAGEPGGQAPQAAVTTFLKRVITRATRPHDPLEPEATDWNDPLNHRALNQSLAKMPEGCRALELRECQHLEFDPEKPYEVSGDGRVMELLPFDGPIDGAEGGEKRHIWFQITPESGWVPCRGVELTNEPSLVFDLPRKRSHFPRLFRVDDAIWASIVITQPDDDPVGPDESHEERLAQNVQAWRDVSQWCDHLGVPLSANSLDPYLGELQKAVDSSQDEMVTTYIFIRTPYGDAAITLEVGG